MYTSLPGCTAAEEEKTSDRSKSGLDIGRAAGVFRYVCTTINTLIDRMDSVYAIWDDQRCRKRADRWASEMECVGACGVSHSIIVNRRTMIRLALTWVA